MNARRQVFYTIRQSIKEKTSQLDRETCNIPQVILPKQDEIPPMHAFMCPLPDIDRLEELAHKYGSSDDYVSSILLGSYQSMHSQGIVTLYSSNLTNFFWRLVLDIDVALPTWNWRQEDFKMLAEWVANQTYYHERFHHSMDGLRLLFDVQTFDSLQEEALAVAYSRYSLNQDAWNKLRDLNVSVKMPFNLEVPAERVLRGEFLRLAFCYTSPGYRDWQQYADVAALQTGVCDYLRLKNSTWLRSLRIPVEQMVFDLLLVEGGFEERVL